MTNQQNAALLLRNFEAFARMAFRYLHDGQELGNEPYLTFVCRRLAKAKEPGARIVLNMPPRHLKTLLGSVFLAAWLLASSPAEKIMIITYSEALAVNIAYLLRKILQSAWYCRYFRTRLSDDRTRVADFTTTAGGGVYAVSAEGSITGRGASVIIFDDPLNIDDASNLKQIEKINQRFDTFIRWRLDDPSRGRILIIAHRLHSNDLSGHVLKSGDWDTSRCRSWRRNIKVMISGIAYGAGTKVNCCDLTRLGRRILISSGKSLTRTSRHFTSNFSGNSPLFESLAATSPRLPFLLPMVA